MKKVVCVILCAVFVTGFAGFVSFQNASSCYFEISAGVVKIECYSKCVSLFSSKKKLEENLSKAESDIEKVIGISSDETLMLSFEKRPLKVLCYNLENENKIAYDKETKSYMFNPVWDNSECWISVIADYGVAERIITFCVYNKDYKNEYKDEDEAYTKFLQDSKVNDSNVSESVHVSAGNPNYPVDSSAYSFDIVNNEKESITTSSFIIEKNIDGKWYAVEKEMNSLVAESTSAAVTLSGEKLSQDEKRTVCLETSLYLFFDDGVAFHDNTGVYRYVVPYTVGDKSAYAVSDSFTVGYEGKTK